jgi:hypothetical protein
MSLSNLAHAMSERFKQSGNMEDLEQGITCHREALAHRPIGHPFRSPSLSDIAHLLLARFEHLGRTEDLEDAFDLFQASANHSNSSVVIRFHIACAWAKEAHHKQHHSTVDAYSSSLTLLDYCLTVTPTVESQQTFLATSGIPKSLVSDSAAFAVSIGQLDTAIELLEQGRTLLWAKMLSYRHPLEDLRETDRALADRFETIGAQLEHLALSFGSETAIEDSGLPVSVDNMINTQRRLSEQWEKVVEQIRMLGGNFTDFLRAVPFSTLKTAAAEGPVIVVNISEYRSDAIIIRENGPSTLVHLTDASPEHLASLTSDLLDAQTSRSTPQIVDILRRLWDMVVSSVRDELDALQVPKGTRVWWCPNSLANGLPLHAAGPGPRVRGPKIFSDIYISSYTPTLSALIRARSGVVHSGTTPKLLAMGQASDNLPDSTLPLVREELRRVQSFGDFVDVLADNQANRQAVISSLRQHNWIHFACHGYQEDQPFHSYFQLCDGERLTLIDLAQARLPDAEFAFLSTCESAAGDNRGTPDEVIHLAAAMQFSGFRSVVGTLWSMSDSGGPEFADEFYRYMFRKQGEADFRDAAAALNAATRKLRRKVAAVNWICLIHIGA